MRNCEENVSCLWLRYISTHLLNPKFLKFFSSKHHSVLNHIKLLKETVLLPNSIGSKLLVIEADDSGEKKTFYHNSTLQIHPYQKTKQMNKQKTNQFLLFKQSLLTIFSSLVGPHLFKIPISKYCLKNFSLLQMFAYFRQDVVINANSGMPVGSKSSLNPENGTGSNARKEHECLRQRNKIYGYKLFYSA